MKNIEVVTEYKIQKTWVLKVPNNFNVNEDTADLFAHKIMEGPYTTETDEQIISQKEIIDG